SFNCLYTAAPSHIFLFSFYCDGHHLHLHSFPTRRSSDLTFIIVLMTVLTLAACGDSANEDTDSGDDDSKNDKEIVFGLINWPERSEEHTSELQSRFDLVCRLLLEKKK